MNLKSIVIVMLLAVSVLLITTGCATSRESVSEEDFFSAYIGTWTNPENTGEMTDPQLAVYQRDKTMIYGKMESELPILTVRPLFTATWRDDDGNIWFTSEWEHSMAVKHYEVGKISKGGTMIERAGAHEPIQGWSPRKPFSEIAKNNTCCYNLVLYKD